MLTQFFDSQCINIHNISDSKLILYQSSDSYLFLHVSSSYSLWPLSLFVTHSLFHSWLKSTCFTNPSQSYLFPVVVLPDCFHIHVLLWRSFSHFYFRVSFFVVLCCVVFVWFRAVRYLLAFKCMFLCIPFHVVSYSWPLRCWLRICDIARISAKRSLIRPLRAICSVLVLVLDVTMPHVMYRSSVNDHPWWKHRFFQS